MGRAEPLDLCGIVSGLSLLDAYKPQTFSLVAKRATVLVHDLDARQLSLLSNAFARQSHRDPELFISLLQQVPRMLGHSSGRDVAVLLNSLAQISGNTGDYETENPSHGDGMQLAAPLSAIGERLPELLPTMDLLSLV